jgi:tetratricopeptide (TPR) repeat protein
MYKFSLENTINKASKLNEKVEIIEDSKIYNSVLNKYPNDKSAQNGLKELTANSNFNKKPFLPEQKLKELTTIYNIKNFEKAFNFGTYLLDHFDCGSQLYFILGVISSSLKRNEDSIKFFNKVIEIDPLHQDALFNLGVVYQNNSNFELAIFYYQKVKNINDKNFFATMNTAICLNSLGNYFQSYNTYKECIKLNPNYPNIYINLSSILINLGKNKEAMINLDKAMDLGVKTPEIFNDYGILLNSEKEYNQAILFYQKAIILNPNYSNAFINYGTALIELDKFEEALKMFKSAIDINPNSSEAYSNMAGLLNIQKEHTNSLIYSLRAAELNKNNYEAFNNSGVSYFNLKQYKKAIEMYELALHINPNFVTSILNLGAALSKLGNVEDAIEKFKKTVQLDPENIQAYLYWAETLNSYRKYEQALEISIRLLEIAPESADAFANLGNTLCNMKLYKDALDYYYSAIKIQPNNFHILNSIGLCLIKTKNYIKAEKILNNSIDISNNHIAFNNLGYLYSEIGDLLKVKYNLLEAIRYDSDYADGHLNLGLLLLLEKNYARGLKEYEWRLKKNSGNTIFVYNYDTSFKRWNKSIDLRGKFILVSAEQGLGDSIQFSRFINYLLDKKCKIIFRVQDCLVELLSNIHDEIKVISEKDFFEDFDYQIPLISLLYEMDFDPKKYNYKPSYLNYHNIDKSDEWRSKFNKKEFLIGVSWQASKNSEGKSFKLKQLKEIANIKGVKLVSLQKNFGVEQLNDDLDFEIQELGENFDNQSQAFIDTAAVIKNLDLIITCDTALVHLAGALECNTFCALKKYPDWRWGLIGEKTFWYDTVKLFRQNNIDNWEDVFKNMKNEIVKLL